MNIPNSDIPITRSLRGKLPESAFVLDAREESMGALYLDILICKNHPAMRRVSKTTYQPLVTIPESDSSDKPTNIYAQMR